ncbi:MAG TPA: actin-binding WH2 domain-containing protein [Oscillatoriales cyanobacterium M59_W2019_021]|nr:MAG: actin-binding WH2 domain-containing protein [Cyanobacteria bacterium J055]HIK32349.1 actin-binding WH2 domain-containing protein [Oscillatoriales cyanobacterium M4454_W2019_049]HIK52943.1 actin-binding WH2 domain-containing protein [Oscillatoriales cyanobacterium M59_W2019_021]
MKASKSPVSNYFSVLIDLLRDRHSFMAEIGKNERVNRKIIALLFSSSIFFAVYGLIIGASSSWMQAISSAVKLPILYLMTMMICLPTLYFFNILFGSRKNFTQHLGVVIAAVASISVLLFSFAPVSLFFLISAPNQYSFFLLLNVAILGLTGFVGVKFLYDGMQLMSEQEDETFEGKKNRTKLLKSWLFLYAFVGSQLGWTLRPFFGAPEQPFQLFRNLEGNFYQGVLNAILNVLNLN